MTSPGTYWGIISEDHGPLPPLKSAHNPIYWIQNRLGLLLISRPSRPARNERHFASRKGLRRDAATGTAPKFRLSRGGRALACRARRHAERMTRYSQPRRFLSYTPSRRSINRTRLLRHIHDDNICETRFSMLCASCLELTTENCSQ